MKNVKDFNTFLHESKAILEGDGAIQCTNRDWETYADSYESYGVGDSIENEETTQELYDNYSNSISKVLGGNPKNVAFTMEEGCYYISKRAAVGLSECTTGRFGPELQKDVKLTKTISVPMMYNPDGESTVEVFTIKGIGKVATYAAGDPWAEFDFVACKKNLINKFIKWMDEHSTTEWESY